MKLSTMRATANSVLGWRQILVIDVIENWLHYDERLSWGIQEVQPHYDVDCGGKVVAVVAHCCNRYLYTWEASQWWK